MSARRNGTGAALALAAAMNSTGVSAQPTGDGSSPTSYNSAVQFLDQMARDRHFTLMAYQDQGGIFQPGGFSYHAVSDAMSEVQRCKFTFFASSYASPGANPISRTIDFTVRRDVQQSRYNNVLDGIDISGPVEYTDSKVRATHRIRGGINFGMEDSSLLEMSLKAFQFIVDSCSTQYRFK